jgi:aryl-alcohol dehydrogenase-like predicted oxidoreductase
MAKLHAGLAGTFAIGGDLPVVRLGFGAMRITGPGIWGPPADRGEALRTLRRLPELGVNFIDTADSYGPNVSETLIREALHPYANVHVATKAGLTRAGPDQWKPRGDAAYLLQQARASRERLGVQRIDLWQLHRIDPRVPQEEQFGAVRTLIDAGVIRHAGLSQVGVREIEAARKYFPVSTVQNLYNLADRSSEEVVSYCEREGIGFIPWFPLAAGKLAAPGALLSRIAQAHEATPGQIALAWLLRRSPVMLPIPGTGQERHLQENVAAAAVTLRDDEFARLCAV